MPKVRRGSLKLKCNDLVLLCIAHKRQAPLHTDYPSPTLTNLHHCWLGTFSMGSVELGPWLDIFGLETLGFGTLVWELLFTNLSRGTSSW